MFIVMFVSKDAEQASEILDLWVKAGISGITILESAGMSQLRPEMHEATGLTFSLTSLIRGQEIHHRTLFSAVKDEATMNRLVKVTTEFVGDWTNPDVGVLLVWPLVQAYGLEKQFPARTERKSRPRLN